MRTSEKREGFFKKRFFSSGLFCGKEKGPFPPDSVWDLFLFLGEKYCYGLSSSSSVCVVGPALIASVTSLKCCFWQKEEEEEEEAPFLVLFYGGRVGWSLV